MLETILRRTDLSRLPASHKVDSAQKKDRTHPTPLPPPVLVGNNCCPASIFHRELNPVLCDHLEGWYEDGWEEGLRGREYMYTSG